MDNPDKQNSFIYFLPHKELQKYIAYYSIYTGELPQKSPVFIPDLGGAITINQWHDPIINLRGPYNKLTTIHTILNGNISQFFIEFQPGGLSFLIYPLCHEILNKQIMLEDINKILVLKLNRMFEQHHTTEQIIASLNSLFLNILNSKTDNIGHEILKTLQYSEITITMKDFSEKIGYTSRHINRYLNGLVGVSGKRYIKIKRFCRSIEMLKKPLPLEKIAYKLGYFDTPHFIHEFMTITGFPPSKFRENMSDFYNDSMKRL
jgi:AraC-like DNA-binding protein